jgi:circadian clock protein KaiC
MNQKTKAEALIKIPTGIAGFDELTRGGLPDKRTAVLVGAPGTGKTIFALQTLVNTATRGEPGIFVSFEENVGRLMVDAASCGLDLAEFQKKKLILLDARMQPGAVKVGHFDLMGMLAGLRAVATDLGARRIVFDSIDVLLTLLDDRMAELQEIFRLRDWLSENGFTSLITANLTSGDPSSTHRYAMLQFISDCTVALGFRQDPHSASRHLRVVKYRGAAFFERECSFTIGQGGINLMFPGRSEGPAPGLPVPIHSEVELARQDLSARVQALDRFLEIKQAELKFLREQQAQAQGDGPSRGPRRAKSAPKRTAPSKGSFPV